MPAFAGMTTFLYGETDRISGNMTLNMTLEEILLCPPLAGVA